MRRLPAIILLLGFLALGSGLLESLHLQTHLREHENANLPASDSRHSEPADGDCQICRQLHLPTISAGWVPLLICLGLFVAFLTQLAPRVVPQRTALRIDCRGPPRL